jgi:hypothetical protein
MLFTMVQVLPLAGADETRIRDSDTSRMRLEETVDEIEDEGDLDSLHKFCPFLIVPQSKLRQRLADHVTEEFYLRDVPGSTRNETIKKDKFHEQQPR